MHKLLIVDDEPLMREGLKHIISWEEFGFTLIGECDNGDDGLDTILAKKPDLVIIDIKMPGKHGIEVIDEARKQGFDGKVIILTGFSNFNYAKSAIRLNVDEYLLKPLDENELSQTVRRIAADLSKKAAEVPLSADIPAQSSQQLVMDLILGTHRGVLSQNILHAHNLNASVYRVAVLCAPSPEEPPAEHILGVERLKNALEQVHNLSVLSFDRKILLLARGQRTCDTLCTSIERCLKEQPASLRLEDAFAGVGRRVTLPEEITLSYDDALKVLKRQFFCAGKAVVCWEDIQDELHSGELKTPDIYAYIDKLYAAIEVGNSERIQTLLGDLEQEFRATDLAPEAIRAILVNLHTMLKERLLTEYPDSRECIPEDTEVVHSLFKRTSLNSVMAYLALSFCGISAFINSVSCENVLKRMQNYILKNYASDLKLEKLAEIFGYNSAYLGKLFKSGTGESFNQYLDGVRIERAKEFLSQNNLMVYQIAEKLGYKNINYFYLKFKKITGMSPREYVRDVLHREDSGESEEAE